MERTITVNDTLRERVESAIEDVKNELLNYLKENPDTDEVPDLGNDLDYSGAIHEIVDGSVPVYTHEIDTIHFLYGSEVEQAWENAGTGEERDENWKAVAIYYYIDQEVSEWYSENAEEIFNERRGTVINETEEIV
jgi:hypothetical protein